ncbi:MAG: ABC transporter permease subunit [Candidatus Bathyarchaeota archaeon]|nr:ABC transporter permease subunit [Candidatus Bathyarchaeota archaeon]
MNTHKVWLVFKKDWLEIKRNWQVLMPIIIVPIMIAVLLPTIVALIPSFTTTTQTTSIEGFEALIANLPAQVQNQIATMDTSQVMVYIMLLYFFAPFFLIIPVMASSVLGSDSFAGEKERKTIEALLATPISDSELFLGKVLVSFIPAMAITLASFALYSVVVDIAALSLFNGALLLPNVNWMLLIFGLAPAIALASIGLSVLVSAKVKGFKEAQQISVVLLIPILGLVFGQVSGAILIGPLLMAVLIGVLGLVDFAVFFFGVKVFKREEILSKQS